ISCIDLSNKARTTQAVLKVSNIIKWSMDVGELIHYMQVERGYTALHFITARETKINQLVGEIRMLVKESFTSTDQRIDALNAWPLEGNPAYGNISDFSEFKGQLNDYRKKLF
ncbi:unnamed protein product, partial [Lymnaea stagnalis]